jgi:putative peptide zinc metalloprotease protein
LAIGAAFGPPLSGDEEPVTTDAPQEPPARPPAEGEEATRGVEGTPAETQTAAQHADGRPPKLADGIELIGEYEDSGYKEPPAIARRADGQVIQLPKLLYFVAESADGKRSYAQIAERVTEATGRGVSGDDIRFLVNEKLRPLGVLVQADGSSPQVQKADPMLALKFRAALVPEGAVRAITTVFYPLFFSPVILAALAGLAAVDVWLFFFHGIAQPARELVYNPLLLLMIFGLIVLGTALHEVGHATAARYGGAKPGVMGAGVYIVWPAFYTDVTDAYRLDRKGRLRTDFGGVYFNVLFALATTGAYFLTSFEPLLIVVLIQHFQILQQLLPLLRLDGYYILSDLTGVPDLFMRLKPTLTSLIPGKKDESADQLKPWVRVVVTGWVIVLIPVLFFIFGFMVINAPRIFATAWDSFLVHYDQASDAFGGGKALSGVVSSGQMVMLALPAAGITYSSSRAGSKALGGGWRWSEGSPARRLALLAASAGIVGLIAFVWWPNGEYKPIQPEERGTIPGAIAQFDEVATGRPALTPEREDALGGAPFEREEDTTTPTEEPTSTSPTETSTTETSTTETSTTETTTTPTTTAVTTTTP